MSIYNTQLQSNNVDLQTVLQTLQNKAAGGEQAMPVIDINSSTGLITATAGTKSATKQLAFQAAKTIAPGTTNQTAVAANTYVGGAITIKGDSNLVAGNIKKGTSIFGVAGDYEGSGSSGGDTSMEDALIDGTITTYTNDRVKEIKGYTFNSRTNLTSVSFPVCITIGRNAFEDCTKLTSINFPACTSIGSYAFYRCSNLTTAVFPVCTSIGLNAFRSCHGLKTANFPVCTFIGNDAFQNCSSLTSINFPACTSIGGYAFYGCYSLTTAVFPVCTSISYNAFMGCKNLRTTNFPVCTFIDDGAFGNCDNLTSINFPACITINEGAFEGCNNLTSINFPVCTTIGVEAFWNCGILTSINFPACISIGNSAFYSGNMISISFPVCSYIGIYAFDCCDKLTLADFGNSTLTGCAIYSSAFNRCSKLTTLILRYGSVVTLSNVNAFTSTPMSVSTLTGAFGSIYVPASLVAAYKSATNWAKYADRITAIAE